MPAIKLLQAPKHASQQKRFRAKQTTGMTSASAHARQSTAAFFCVYIATSTSDTRFCPEKASFSVLLPQFHMSRRAALPATDVASASRMTFESIIYSTERT
jgi:hypothetical protein